MSSQPLTKTYLAFWWIVARFCKSASTYKKRTPHHFEWWRAFRAIYARFTGNSPDHLVSVNWLARSVFSITTRIITTIMAVFSTRQISKNRLQTFYKVIWWTYLHLFWCRRPFHQHQHQQQLNRLHRISDQSTDQSSRSSRSFTSFIHALKVNFRPVRKRRRKATIIWSVLSGINRGGELAGSTDITRDIVY